MIAVTIRVQVNPIILNLLKLPGELLGFSQIKVERNTLRNALITIYLLQTFAEWFAERFVVNIFNSIPAVLPKLSSKKLVSNRQKRLSAG
jgi:hypothetical protein